MQARGERLLLLGPDPLAPRLVERLARGGQPRREDQAGSSGDDSSRDHGRAGAREVGVGAAVEDDPAEHEPEAEHDADDAGALEVAA